MTQVAESIRRRAQQLGLTVDKLKEPAKAGPDCYMFYGVAMTEACRRWGGCEQHPYYAFIDGDSVVIVNNRGDRYS